MPDGLLNDDKFNALSQVVIESAPSEPSHKAAVTLLEKVAAKADGPPQITQHINQGTAKRATILHDIAQERFSQQDIELGEVKKGRDKRRIPNQGTYHRDVFRASMDGREVIAAYYNKKYFENTDSTIVVAQSPEDLNDKMETAIKEASKHTRPIKLGITLSADRSDPFHHSVSLILERTTDQKWKLYIADSVGSNMGFVDALEMELPEAVTNHNIQVLCPTTGRQNSFGHCHTESLTFLKNALLLPGSVSDYIREVSPKAVVTESTDKQKPHIQKYLGAIDFKDPEDPDGSKSIERLKRFFPGVMFFHYKPELLKTEQSMSRFEAVNPGNQETPLPNTQKQETVSQFFKKHKGEATYQKEPKSGPETSPETITVPENAYLHRKTEEHKRLLDEYKAIKNPKKDS